MKRCKFENYILNDGTFALYLVKRKQEEDL